MYRAFPIACLTLALLAPAARADDANRYEIVVVPASATPGDGKTETLLIDRQTGKTWMRTTDFDPATFAAKSTYWVPQPFKVVPPEADKPFVPPN
jgi:hypothetical protein